ncbi:hypothetical protein EUTSA_v10005609mg, partial [Eutrema salsugineum]
LYSYTNHLFYGDALYPTDNVTKNHTFYEYILVDSKSIKVTHYPDPKNPNHISYSTCKILRVASMQQLGILNLHTSKTFSQPGFVLPGYTYVDYMQAFFRVLYLRPYDHSWFLSFDQRFNKHVPGWFNEWWHWFGPIDQIYPPEIIKTSYPFYTKHLPNTNPIGPLNKIYFHADMGIPWICSWHFNLVLALPNMPYSLVKEFRVKWWDKYNIERCSLTNIKKLFDANKQDHLLIKSISRSIPLLTPSQIANIPPYHPPTQIKQEPPSPAKNKKPSSPTHSSSSSQKSKSKKSKLQAMKETLKALSQEMMNISFDDDSVHGQEPAENPEDLFGGPLSQDPFDL